MPEVEVAASAAETVAAPAIRRRRNSTSSALLAATADELEDRTKQYSEKVQESLELIKRQGAQPQPRLPLPSTELGKLILSGRCATFGQLSAYMSGELRMPPPVEGGASHSVNRESEPTTCMHGPLLPLPLKHTNEDVAAEVPNSDGTCARSEQLPKAAPSLLPPVQGRAPVDTAPAQLSDQQRRALCSIDLSNRSRVGGATGRPREPPPSVTNSPPSADRHPGALATCLWPQLTPSAAGGAASACTLSVGPALTVPLTATVAAAATAGSAAKSPKMHAKAPLPQPQPYWDALNAASTRGVVPKARTRRWSLPNLSAAVRAQSLLASAGQGRPPTATFMRINGQG